MNRVGDAKIRHCPRNCKQRVVPDPCVTDAAFASGRRGSNSDLRVRRPAATPKNVHGRGVPAVACMRCPVDRRRTFLQRPLSPRSTCNTRITGPSDVFKPANAETTFRSHHSTASGIARRHAKRARHAGHPSQWQGVPVRLGKIAVAMTKAFLAVEGNTAGASRRVHESVEQLTADVVTALSRRAGEGRTFHIEDVQDQVELALMRSENHKVARAYVLYREDRARKRAEETAAQTTAEAHPTLHVALADGSRIRLDNKRLELIVNEACAGLDGVSPPPCWPRPTAISTTASARTNWRWPRSWPHERWWSRNRTTPMSAPGCYWTSFVARSCPTYTGLQRVPRKPTWRSDTPNIFRNM